ncbi:matrixin family metalloprotease [Arthrobacter sp. JZ12]|uniref:matrixin family metalloprotease n=1 Tax=Arthrobacter sp. JZ12 TaxID=2654190 RepID=UPI002B460195|nr:matrixin family metalloprotease [Arthrobacter sp. JZ12]WRH24159.1 matrixin family metalloprotease [Arthrobacter sp. JZ12]
MGVLDREWFHREDEPSSRRPKSSGVPARPSPADGSPGGLRRSASGRVPQWALEEALNEQLRAYAADNDGRRRRKTPRRRRPRSSASKLRVRTAALIALVAVLYLAPSVLQREILPDLTPHLPWSNVPPRGVEASSTPLGAPPPSTGSSQYALYSFEGVNQDVVAYDPCRPVHYVIRPDFAPAGSEGLVQEAVAEVAAATGLTFVFDGPTVEGPSPEVRDPYQPELYGERWAPILITWTSPTEVPELTGAIAGLGGSEIAQRPGKPIVLVAGQTMLDAPDLANILSHPGGRDQVRAVIVHELAHVLGLDHVNDPTQLMHESSPVIELADGDRAGLARLGAGPCVPEL